MKKNLCIMVVLALLASLVLPCAVVAETDELPVRYVVLDKADGWAMGRITDDGEPKPGGEITEKVDATDSKKSTYIVTATSGKGNTPDSFVMVDMTTAFEIATGYRSGKNTAAIKIATDIISVSIAPDVVEDIKEIIRSRKIFFKAKKNEKIQNNTVRKQIDDACFEIEYGFVGENGKDILFTEVEAEKDTLYEEYPEYEEEEAELPEEVELIPYVFSAEVEIPHIFETSSKVKVYERELARASKINFSYDGKKVKYTTKKQLPVIVAEEMNIEIKGRTLDLQGTITMVFYAELEGADPNKTKMLFWTAPQKNYTEDTAELAVYSSGKDKNGFKFEYENISSKEMSKDVYARLVTTDDDGKAVYGAEPAEPYSVVAYAHNMMKKNKSLEPLLVKMLNYGTAAQEYFGSENKPANEGLTANQRATDFTKYYSSEDAVIEEAVGEKSKAEIYGTTLSLEGDISINYYTLCPDDYDKVGMLFWNEAAYSRTDRHVIGTESRRVTEYQTNGDYKIFTYGNIVSREMYSSVYARLYTVKDGVYSYSDIKKYSVRDYAARQLAKNDDEKLSKLLRCLMLYGEEAKNFFNTK